ncbi:MAG: hypothetical protein IKA90_03710 [Clostridia bacterium]|nr:hypothetical protein [Clostridia bacterium]
MAVDIKAKTEMLDKVVSEFAAQLEEYMKTMKSEITSINNAISTLGEGWQGSDYEVFCETMGERISTINGEMEKCKKLKEWLDNKAQEYRRMLDILNKAGKR